MQQVEDGNDLEAIEQAIQAAQEEHDRPSLIAVRTHIGYGSPNKQNKAAAHGEPLGTEELGLTKANFGWPTEPAFLPAGAGRSIFRQALDKRQENGKRVVVPLPFV